MNQYERDLLSKYLHGQYSDQEREELKTLLERPEAKIFLDEQMSILEARAEKAAANADQKLKEKAGRLKNSVFGRIADLKRERQPKKMRNLWKLSRYAAIFIGMALLVGGYRFFSHYEKKKQDLVLQETEILPGSDKAILTLSDGSTLSLSDTDNGMIMDETGVNVQKTANGEIVYSTSNEPSSPEAYNSVETPRGGQYRITLPDGSKAWLNATSSLTYPVRFKDTERRVRMTGEVYFEVAKLPSKITNGNVPFVVESSKQEIQVLGTHFNVNAYPDEPFTATTLIEGSVKVLAKASGQSVRLRPGQISLLDERIRIQSSDVMEKIAWKEGQFIFNKDTLGSILKQLSRWYDVDTDCPQHLQQKRFSGIVFRNMPLQTVIEMIASTQEIKMKIEGRRLIVSE